MSAAANVRQSLVLIRMIMMETVAPKGTAIGRKEIERCSAQNPMLPNWCLRDLVR